MWNALGIGIYTSFKGLGVSLPLFLDAAFQALSPDFFSTSFEAYEYKGKYASTISSFANVCSPKKLVYAFS